MNPITVEIKLNVRGINAEIWIRTGAETYLLKCSQVLDVTCLAHRLAKGSGDVCLGHSCSRLVTVGLLTPVSDAVPLASRADV